MRTRVLGASGIAVSEVGMGCWAIGGPSWRGGEPVGWSGAEDDASLAGLRRAVELGVTHLDTADVYGDGHSERLVGRLLAEVPRDRVVVASKVGWFQGTAPHFMDPLHIRHQLEQSLANLGTDHLDVYYLHHADFGPEDRYLEPAAELLRDLQREGKIRAVGQSAYAYADFLRVCPVVRPSVVQFSYSALGGPYDDPETDLFAWAEGQGYGIVLFSPLAQGLLLDKFDPEHPPTFGAGDIRAGGERFSRGSLLRLRERLGPIKARFGASPRELARVALQVALARSPNACVIPGFKDAAQVEMNLAGAGEPLSADDVAFVRDQLRG